MSRNNLPEWKRTLVRLRWLGVCAYCGETVGDMYETDHIIPVSNGGSDDILNLTCSCRSCNRSKSDKEGWVPAPAPLLGNILALLYWIDWKFDVINKLKKEML